MLQNWQWNINFLTSELKINKAFTIYKITWDTKKQSVMQTQRAGIMHK